jgi:broad specificity phosphatase PhoE
VTVTTRILLVRHGESEWNATGRWQGQADPPLSLEGRAQAERAAIALRGLVDRIVASDLVRAHHTARIVGGGLSMSVDVDVDMRERDIGIWSGLTMAEVEAGWPGYVAAGKRPEGAELDEPMWTRVSRALLRIARGGGTPLVVSHGGVIALTERTLAPPEPPAPPVDAQGGQRGGDARFLRFGKIHNLEGRWIEVRGEAFSLGERIRLDVSPQRDAVEATGRLPYDDKLVV